MTEHDLSGRTALVTGASSGLGVQFANELAARGADLVLVARREDRLRAVAGDISSRHGVKVVIIARDIAGRQAALDLVADIERRLIRIDVLVNNAGFGLHGDFLAIDADAEQKMLELDISTLTVLTREFAARMKSSGWGRILQLSSIGAYQPSATYAVYGAAKAYVLMYSHAINRELRGTGVSSTVISPGITATEFLQVAGQEPSLYQRLLMMRPEKVAAIGIRAMLKSRPEVIPGMLNALTAFSTRLTPRPLAAAVTEHLMRFG